MNTAPTQRKSTQIAVILSILSATALITPLFAPWTWPLLFVGLVPLFFIGQKLPTKSALLSASVVGFTYFSFVTYPLATMNTWWWTSFGLAWKFQKVLYFGVTEILALVATTLTFCLIFWIYFTFLKEKLFFSAIFLPFSWILLEFVRIQILFGLRWGTLGLPLGENLTLAQLCSFGGPYALSFLAISANYCFFLLFNTKKSEGNEIKMKKWLISGIFLGIVLTAITAVQIPTNEETRSNFAIISTSYQTKDLTQKASAEHIVHLIREATAIHEGIIVLPENVFPFLTLNEATFLPVEHTEHTNGELSAQVFDEVAQISAQNPKISLILGLHTEKNGQKYNSAVVFENGKVISVASKRHLLPFTEKSFSAFRKSHIEPMSVGEKGSLSTQYGHFSAEICSEILTSDEKSDIPLINLSNDNIFDSPRVAAHNKLMTRLRAIEERQPIIRASKGGFSGIYPPSGIEIPAIKNTTGEILFTTVGYPRKSF